MHERLKASEVGQIECQTCEKKIYVVRKILGKIFLKFFSWNLILIYILNYSKEVRYSDLKHKETSTSFGDWINSILFAIVSEKYF